MKHKTNGAETAGKIKMYPSGKLVDPCNLKLADITIGDIAHHLSMVCRWGGGVPGYYSVAEHSIAVAAMVPDHLKKWALLHDAAEAYIGDFVRPVKSRLYFRDWPESTLEPEPISELEIYILDLVAKKFDMVWPIPDAIWAADDAQLEKERIKIADHTLAGNNPATAERLFTYAWKHVTASERSSPMVITNDMIK